MEIKLIKLWEGENILKSSDGVAWFVFSAESKFIGNFTIFNKNTEMRIGFILVLFIGILYAIYYYHPYFFKAFRLTYLSGRKTASIYDLQNFRHRAIPRGDIRPWPEGERFNKYRPSEKFQLNLKSMKTSALLVAHQGKLIHEQYFDKHNKQTVSNSFSIAKAITVLLAGKAIEEGYITADQKVSEFFGQYNYSPADELTLEDLMRMSSGMDWQESYYHPFNVTTAAYYGNNLDDLILSRKIVRPPGRKFSYQSGDTQLLGLILTKVLPESLSTYLSQKIWQPMGMEYPAYWSMDKTTGTEKTYCCIHATARDFLRLGQLFLQDGQWNGKQLISSNFLKMMRTPGFEESPQYGAGLWLDTGYDPSLYLLRGHLGQYVIVIPDRELVICRLGRRYLADAPSQLQSKDIYQYVEGVLEMLRNDA